MPTLGVVGVVLETLQVELLGLWQLTLAVHALAQVVQHVWIVGL
jgi:hypothetical protein